ncbi:MAG: hypothetical protein K5989_09705 [Lachnospiraceae bacterium]|nr:hypothetical protein [Lachnospiraceae bacterium]
MELSEYREVLNRAVRAAHEARNRLTEEEYRTFFAPLDMTEEQDRLTRNYLAGLHISLGDEVWQEDDEPALGGENGNYLRFYLDEIGDLPRKSPEQILDLTRLVMEKDDGEAKQELIGCHLSDVVDIAKLYVYHGLPLEDLIGEGNIGLMMAMDLMGTLNGPEEAEGLIGKMIMDAMDSAIAEDTEERLRMDEIIVRLEGIGKAAKELSEDLRRPVTAAELAKESEFSVEDIEEALRLTGNAIEGLQAEN